MDQNAFVERRSENEQHDIFWVNQCSFFSFFETLWLRECGGKKWLHDFVDLLLEVDFHVLKQPWFSTFGRINGRFTIHPKVVSHKTIGRLWDFFSMNTFKLWFNVPSYFLLVCCLPFCSCFQHSGGVVFGVEGYPSLCLWTCLDPTAWWASSLQHIPFRNSLARRPSASWSLAKRLMYR